MSDTSTIPPVKEKIETLDKYLSELSDNVENLEKELLWVLDPAPSAPDISKTTTESKDREWILVDFLDCFMGRVNSLSKRIGEIRGIQIRWEQYMV